MLGEKAKEKDYKKHHTRVWGHVKVGEKDQEWRESVAD